MDIEMILLEAEEDMKQALVAFQQKLNKISAGRANPKILDGITVNYYGEKTPLSQVCSIQIPEARQILVKPFDINIIKEVLASINIAGLGFNGSNEGDKIRINIPEMTTQRRTELAKSTSTLNEQTKISIRNSRQKANKDIKTIEDLPEDDSKNFMSEVQKLTNEYVEKIDNMTKEKENDLMTI